MKPYWKTEKKANNPKEERERGYHAMTRDCITNEIFYKCTGKTMGEFLREEFPDIDVHAGCTEDLLSRFSDLQTYAPFTRDLFLPSWRRMGPNSAIDLKNLIKKINKKGIPRDEN